MCDSVCLIAFPAGSHHSLSCVGSSKKLSVCLCFFFTPLWVAGVQAVIFVYLQPNARGAHGSEEDIVSSS